MEITNMVIGISISVGFILAIIIQIIVSILIMKRKYKIMEENMIKKIQTILNRGGKSLLENIDNDGVLKMDENMKKLGIGVIKRVSEKIDEQTDEIKAYIDAKFEEFVEPMEDEAGEDEEGEDELGIEGDEEDSLFDDLEEEEAKDYEGPRKVKSEKKEELPKKEKKKKGLFGKKVDDDEY
jgi:hypothetical protein